MNSNGAQHTVARRTELEASRDMLTERKPGEFGPVTAQDRERIGRMQEDAKWFAGLPPEELRKLAGKYVGVKDRKVVASSRTMAGLSRKLAAEGLKYVFIRRVEEPMTVVY